MSSICNKRIMRDIMSLQKNPIDGISIYVNPDNCKNVIAMIVGSCDTPYEDGMFFFSVDFPDQYPFVPPKVLFLNPNPKMRYHPNMYEKGKVCLSILGTWSGPSWTSVQTLSSVLLVLHSLFQDEPLRCEPGHDNDSKNIVQRYSDIVEHEVLHHCYTMSPRIYKYYSSLFRDQMKDHICLSIDRVQKRVDHLNSLEPKLIIAPNPFSRIRITTNYSLLVKRIKNLKGNLPGVIS